MWAMKIQRGANRLSRLSQCVVLGVLFFLSPRLAPAVNPVAWNVSITTTGQDVSWTSPTAVTTGLHEYDWSYQITRLTANALFDVDLLDLLGEDTSGGGTVDGLPISVVDEMLSDDTTGSTANISISVDSNGVGHGSATNIKLGKILGIQISRVTMEAIVSIIGIPLGDYDRDGDVDALDYGVWKSNLGSTTNLAADGDKNGIVDTSDYVLWRDNFGVDTTPSASQLVAVPEPASLTGVWLSLTSILALARWRCARIFAG